MCIDLQISFINFYYQNFLYTTKTPNFNVLKYPFKLLIIQADKHVLYVI